jgi:hypothetical protein
MRFVRMLAYLRSWVLPDFLVKGDMLRPGVLHSVTPGSTLPLGYSYYWSMKPWNCNHLGAWAPESRLLSVAWREAPRATGGPFHGLDLPRAAYLVANVDTVAHNCVFSVTVDLYGDRPVRVNTMHLNPDDEGSWEQVAPEILIVQPQNGKISIRRNLSLQPREIAAIKLTPQENQS